MLLDTVTVCVAGTVLPELKLKLSELGIADKLLGDDELAFRVTGIVTELEPGPVTVTNPTSVPEVGVPAPIETLSVSGDGPEAGVTFSQLLVEYADTERFTGLTEDEINTF